MTSNILKIMASLVFILSLASCEKAELEPNADNFFHVKIEGAELPVWVKGNTTSKKMIIYINGGPGLTSIDVARADLFDWSNGLEQEFAMVYYDQRGCGNAQGNPDESTLTIAQYIKDLDAIIAVLNNQYENPDIFLMGHSFGSFIGVNYLLEQNFEEKIKGWISIDGAYNFDYDLSWQYRRSFLENIANEEIAKGRDIQHWQEALHWTNDNPIIETREHKNEWRAFVGWPGERIIPEEVGDISFADYLGIGFASSYNAFPAFLSSNLNIVNDRLNEDAEGVNLIESVSALSLPTLFIWGKYDDLIAPEEGEEVFNNFGTEDADKYFKLLENSSHEPFISDPEGFQQAISTFVENY